MYDAPCKKDANCKPAEDHIGMGLDGGLFASAPCLNDMDAGVSHPLSGGPSDGPNNRTVCQLGDRNERQRTHHSFV
jgi:hypothetical protein